MSEKEEKTIDPLQTKVEIEDGHINLMPKVKRKVSKRYNKVLFDGVSISKSDDMEVPMDNIGEATDELIILLATGAVIDGKEVEVDQDFVDELDDEDYQNVLKVCEAKMNKGKKKEEEKKD